MLAARTQVEPVVVQCYKTATCFATCWLALLLTEFTFTPWGIVGGLIWVRVCHIPLRTVSGSTDSLWPPGPLCVSDLPLTHWSVKI